MTTLYVTEPWATVRCNRESLEVEINGTATPEVSGQEEDQEVHWQPLQRQHPRIELHRLEAVVLVGRVHMTCEALTACVERGIAVALLDYAGRFRARLVPASSRSSDLPLRQYAASQDEPGRLARAASTVAAKVHNAVEVLVDHQSNDPDNPELPEAIALLKAQVPAILAARSPASLLGYEGNAARTYFEALRTTFRGPIPFTTRRQRPSPDPANALLSFGYVVLGNLLAGRLEARGLDSCIGFFHEVHPGRPSLALDLLEELRHPVVDRFVVRLCNLQILRPEHFEPDPDRPGGVRMARPALKRFFREWEAHLLKPLREEHGTDVQLSEESGSPDPSLPDSTTSTSQANAGKSPGRLAVRQLLDRQIERLVADLRGGPSYRPFSMEDDHARWGRRTPLPSLLRCFRHPAENANCQVPE